MKQPEEFDDEKIEYNKEHPEELGDDDDDY
jgi:hypothetical protein